MHGEVEETRDKREGKLKEGTALRDREPGKSVLPFSRVQRIIKADKELPMVARDATLLISLATEEFIKRLSQACQSLAEREKRATVQQKDVATIVRRADEFLFLDEIIGSQESTGRRKPQKAKVDAEAPSDQDQSQPTLRNFMQRTDENEDNIVMNEDGAMYAG
ncbi:hypothetical protein HD554DRAFT_2205063 [Boletus coccyginus]|nr:hypothetical protein HD554DRAFT_2205063 [Boletus coccyginus]